MSNINDVVNNAETVEIRPPEFSDEALALRFAKRHENDLRYAASWNKWFLWDGCRWATDDTKRAFDLARAICREASAECKDKAAKQIASAKTVAAVVTLARVDRRIAASINVWDTDPWLLNTPETIIDLRNGSRLPNAPGHHMTKVTAAAPSGEYPLWRDFLERITDGDWQLQEYLKRLFGYALTGLTREHVLAFLYGTGANGKSVLLNTVAGVMGDYATSAPMETFVATRNEHHSTELAMLRGARLVTATETEEGRRWAESKIKALTGGDPITARFMRQDHFTFMPQFTLAITGNHKPGLRNVDEAMRRRLHLVPFTVTIPPSERDDQLAEKLKEEWPGILAWMIEGAIEWHREGLQPPEVVRAATDAYITSEDAIAAWIEECCTTDIQGFASNGPIWGSWQVWAEKSGEFVGKKTRLLQAIEDRGFERTKATGGIRGFRGILVNRRKPGIGAANDGQ